MSRVCLSFMRCELRKFNGRNRSCPRAGSCNVRCLGMVALLFCLSNPGRGSAFCTPRSLNTQQTMGGM